MHAVNAALNPDDVQTRLAPKPHHPQDGHPGSVIAMPALPRFALMSMTALADGTRAMQNVSAHGVESTLRYLDGQLELNSSFSTGEPVEGAVVRLLEAMAAQAQSSVEWTPPVACR